MGLVWRRVEEEEVSDSREYPDGSKEDKALEISNCEWGIEDDCYGEPGEPGDTGSDPLKDPDTVHTESMSVAQHELAKVNHNKGSIFVLKMVRNKEL